MKKQFFQICILIIAVLLILGCAKNNQSSISVYGTGTVQVQQDIVQMRITLSHVARTTKMAQEEVSKMVRQALLILKETGIEDKNIMTAALNFSSEYEYTNRRILVGQRAEQAITFTVENIHNDSERLSEIIDRLIQINRIELNQINFSVKDPTEYFIKSRELAFQKAAEKAAQYAELSQLKIKKVLNISEETNQQISPMSNRFMNNSLDYQVALRSEAASTVVPIGELEITTRIFVEFKMK